MAALVSLRTILVDVGSHENYTQDLIVTAAAAALAEVALRLNFAISSFSTCDAFTRPSPPAAAAATAVASKLPVWQAANK